MSASRLKMPAGIVALAATAAALLGLAAPAANAGLLAQTATGCPAESLSQPFLPWGDPNYYTLVPGGTFEAGARPWTLSGGAQEVAGNETFYVNSASDSQSLALPDASSATSPVMCVGIDDPDLRFFARNSGNPLDTLQVSVNFVGPLGLELTEPVGTFTATGSWEPTAIDPILVNLLPLLPGDETPVSFTFAPQGSGGDWQIDDVYVDPWMHGG